MANGLPIRLKRPSGSTFHVSVSGSPAWYALPVTCNSRKLAGVGLTVGGISGVGVISSGPTVAVIVGEGVGVPVGVCAGVFVCVGVFVGVGVSRGVSVGVAVGGSVGVSVGVAVGLVGFRLEVPNPPQS